MKSKEIAASSITVDVKLQSAVLELEGVLSTCQGIEAKVK
jgi:hypothetical protein